MTRMFHKVDETWNPITGCCHGCRYCWARRMAKRFGHIDRYSKGFVPRLNEKEFMKSFRRGALVFVSDMGDMFGQWVPREWILRVIRVIRANREVRFLLLTKNPSRYLDFPEIFGLDNVILGTTVETDLDDMYRQQKISFAPLPTDRLRVMKCVKAKHVGKVMISLEPIFHFSDGFHRRILEVSPDFVYVGHDNYFRSYLDAPTEKVLVLIDRLREEGVEVYEKTIRRADSKVCELEI